jgi:hypothetical protein
MGNEEAKMRFYQLISGYLMGLLLLACAHEVPNSAGSDVAGDATEARVSQDMLMVRNKLEASKLAEVPIGDGTITFYQLSLGEFAVEKRFPIGMAEPTVAKEDQLSLAELYAAYAPGQPVPQRVLEASRRARVHPESAESAARTEVGDGAPTTRSSEGNAPTPHGGRDPEEPSWFQQNYCTYLSGDSTTCFDNEAWGGAWIERTNTHLSKGAMCTWTGFAAMQLLVDGSYEWGDGIDSGWCETVVYHHSHNWLGWLNKATQRYEIPQASGVISFSAHFADNDCFVI